MVGNFGEHNIWQNGSLSVVAKFAYSNHRHACINQNWQFLILAIFIEFTELKASPNSCTVIHNVIYGDLARDRVCHRGMTVICLHVTPYNMKISRRNFSISVGSEHLHVATQIRMLN